MDNKSPQAIDIVITWVDGNDPVLNQKRQQYLSSNIASDATSTTRFASNEEIYFCIASILKNFSQCGTIYIVTDQQEPEFINDFVKDNLCAADKIHIIDHQVLFAGYTQFLPVFNSLSIEAMLWNIPNISNQFIYFNDDVFLNAPLQVEDCFRNDKVMIYGHWKSNSLLKIKYIFRKFLHRTLGKKLQPRFTIAQMLSADMIGLNRHYELDHRPHFIQTDVLKKYFLDHPQQLQQQIGFKFRNFEQFLPVGLNNHLCIQQNRAELHSDVPVVYVKPMDDLQVFESKLNQVDIKYGCIQSLDQMSETEQKIIRQHMMEKFWDFLPHVLKNV